MTMSKQVECINKRPSHYDRHHRILAIGGAENGVRWKRTQEEAITDVKRDRYAYYTHVNGKSAWVIVAKKDSHEYLKTEADDYQTDNLLALQECP
jgi:hypothetical protein